jgi:hypothetical protein
MVVRVGTTPFMSSRKRKPGRPKGRQPTYTLYARVAPEVGAAFERYIEATEPRPSDKAVIELAIKEFLRSRDFWPPKSGQ